MSGLVQLDVSAMAEKIHGEKVAHLHTMRVSPGTKAHCYSLDPEAGPRYGDERDAEAAGMIILIDDAGGYDAFLGEGVDMLSGAPVASGHVSDLMADDSPEP